MFDDSRFLFAFFYAFVYMGCFQSVEKPINVSLSDDFLIPAAGTSRKKILLLGSAFSGKTTLFNQLKYIYGDGFDKEDLLKNKKLIYHQIVSEMVKAIDIAKEDTYLTPTIDSEQIKQIIQCNNDLLIVSFINSYYITKTVPDIIITMINQYIADFMVYPDFTESRKYILDNSKYFDPESNLVESNDINLNEKMKSHIKTLWNKSSIKSLFKLRKVFKLDLFGSNDYFWNNIDQIFQNDYIPTIHDILRLSKHSTGVMTQEFVIKKNHFEIVDVGGIQSERKKWIDCFENVTAVIFVASLSCYDEYLSEDKEITAMNDQLTLFQQVMNNEFFKDSTMILLLTKTDLFEEKIKTIPLNIIDPMLDKLETFMDLIDFMKKFIPQNEDMEHFIFSHHANLLDGDRVAKIFGDIHHIVIENSLCYAS